MRVIPPQLILQMTTKQIEKALIAEYLGKEPICSIRINQLGSEMDFITISRLHYVTEYEIKISKSDFMADLKKDKHKEMSVGKGRVRRFNYVTPQGLLDLKDIPPYAGLIEVSPTGTLRTIKHSQNLRCKKISEELIQKIYRSMMYRFLKSM